MLKLGVEIGVLPMKLNWQNQGLCENINGMNKQDKQSTYQNMSIARTNKHETMKSMRTHKTQVTYSAYDLTDSISINFEISTK